jgi:hypothetical protein
MKKALGFLAATIRVLVVFDQVQFNQAAKAGPEKQNKGVRAFYFNASYY